MAKRKNNKSSKIREVLAENPNATPKEIAATLKARRVKVSAALISRVKYGAKYEKRKAHSNGAVLEHLLAAKALVARVGSVEAARSAVDSLAKLLA